MGYFKDVEKKSLAFDMIPSVYADLEYIARRFRNPLDLENAARIAIVKAADAFRSEDRIREEISNKVENNSDEPTSDKADDYEVDGRDF